MILPKSLNDKKLILGFCLAHLLLYFTFLDKNIFWYTFTASMLFLISYSIFIEEIESQLSFLTYFFYGLVSGIILYCLFWLGNFMIDLANLPLAKDISQIYKRLSPSLLWHYIVLILVIIPGEEFFWRGLIQKRLLKNTLNIHFSVFLASFLYASAQVYSGSLMLPFAAFVSGIFWGYLYAWKQSLPLVIVSHLIFDLFLLVIYPFS